MRRVELEEEKERSGLTGGVFMLELGMNFILRYRVLFQIVAYVFVAVPSGFAGIMYLVEKFSGTELTVSTVSILWVILPPQIIGLIMIGVLIRQGRQPLGVVGIDIEGMEWGDSTKAGYPPDVQGRILRLELYITTIPSREIKSVRLKCGKHSFPINWKPVYGGNLAVGGYYYICIPDEMKSRKHKACLIATVGNHDHKERLILEVPDKVVVE